MLRFFFAVLVASMGFLSAPAAAQSDWNPIKDREVFMELLDGKSLNIWYYVLKLRVLDDGTISGRAFGGEITGDWEWKDGYFCRKMRWEDSYEVEYNCQLVEIKDQTMRFTVDQGAGEYADFKLR